MQDGKSRFCDGSCPTGSRRGGQFTRHILRVLSLAKSKLFVTFFALLVGGWLGAPGSVSAQDVAATGPDPSPPPAADYLPDVAPPGEALPAGDFDLPSFKVQNIFDPQSTPAEQIREVAWMALGICAVIFLGVGGAGVYAIWKFRVRPGDEGREPPQIYGSNQIEMAWTIVPVLIVFVMILVTARTILGIEDYVGPNRPEAAVKIRLVGHQWWWEVHYPDLGVITANEIHVPVSSDGQRAITEIILESADVIHSFWVPQLAGKTDLIPNHQNHTWIEPKRVGIYYGNCAEYCGTQHANMLLRVVVHEREDFDRWVANQQRPAVEDPAVAAGRADFMNTSCVNCHTIQGTIARGTFGPDLTHLASRQTIAAGAANMNHEDLDTWLKDPALIKTGARMPDMQLTPQQVDNITAYLMSLR